MTKYLQSKVGSIEEVAAKMSKYATESGYQDMFKKELEKAGKGIGSMTPAEKKAFFNKIDSKYTAKNEETIKESTDINFMKGDGAEVSYLKRHGSFVGGGKYYKFRGVNINFFVYYNEKNKNYVQQLKLTSGNRPSSDREYDKMYDMLKKLGNEKRLGKLDDSDVDIYFEGMETMVPNKKDDEKVDNPYAVGMSQAMKSTGDKPPLKKSTITKAHDIAKSIEKDQKNEEKDVPPGHHKMPDGTIMKDSEHKKDKKETHSYVTNKMNQAKKDAPGEKKIVKLSFKEAYKKVKKEAMNTVGDATADQANQLPGTGPKENDPDIKKPKAKADTGSKATPVDTSPEVEYKN